MGLGIREIKRPEGPEWSGRGQPGEQGDGEESVVRWPPLKPPVTWGPAWLNRRERARDPAAMCAPGRL